MGPVKHFNENGIKQNENIPISLTSTPYSINNIAIAPAINPMMRP